ncbi:MAG: type II toxin-antitoxin system antitoxin SocA domain-containing protein [bacterium]
MKNKTQVLNIIKEILKQMREARFTVGITRLVKLLYLLELEYYRVFQKRLTEVEWQFYHYGPYPPEIEGILGSPEIEQEEIDLSDERNFRKLSIAKDSYEEYCTESGIKTLVTRLVKEWGGVDIRSLLDYVYFETEPMQEAKRGNILDFSKIQPWHTEKVLEIKIDHKKLNEIRKKIKEDTKDAKRPIIKVIADKTLSECLHIWDEGSRDIRIIGDVIISTEETDSK